MLELFPTLFTTHTCNTSASSSIVSGPQNAVCDNGKKYTTVLLNIIGGILNIISAEVWPEICNVLRFLSIDGFTNVGHKQKN